MSNPGVLDLKPLEIKDFSGGMTDYFLQGAPNRYERADNFLINVDKMIYQREGSVGFDLYGNHKLPAPSARITAFMLFKNESILLTNQGREIYYLNSVPAWTALKGPTGNEAMGAGDTYSALSQVEWKDHLYLTNDAGPIPSKVYIDSNNAYQVRTVGLPLPKSVPTYTTSALLLSCINLANDIRTSMIGHFNDASSTNPFTGPVAGFLHAWADLYSLSYLQTVVFPTPFYPGYPGPQPTPTPAPSAFDEASLYTLIEALSLAYEYHALDPNEPLFHYLITIKLPTNGGLGIIPPKGPYQRLSDNSKPSDLETAAQQLNQLRTRWYWHRWGLYTHSVKGDLALNQRWDVTAPAITTSDFLGNVDTTGVPTFTSNYADVFRYVNYLKNVYNLHVSNGANGADWNGSPSAAYYHSQVMNDSFFHLCTVPDATDLDSAFLIIYQIWAMYGNLPVFDSNVAVHRNVTWTQTTSSQFVTSVAFQVGGAAATIPIGSWVWKGNSSEFNDPNPLNMTSARVLGSASGTATLSKTMTNSGAAQAAQYSASWYHVSTNGAAWPGNLVPGTDTTTLQAGADEFLSPSPSSGLDQPITLPPSTEAWISLADQVWFALATHMENAATHNQSEATVNLTQGNGPFFTPQIAEYAYAVVYDYKYKLDTGVEFENRSAPIFIGPIETSKIFPTFTQMPVPAGNLPLESNNYVTTVSSVQVTNLPVLANDSNTNYDVTEIKVEIYRTLDGGSTYYLLGSVDNGTTTFTDSVSDTADGPGVDRLDTRQELYITGGVVENDQPPPSRFMHILNNTAYYGYIREGDQLLKNRIRQSVPGSPDAAPATFFDDVDDELTGISSARNVLIALCQKSIYRMQGSFNNLGQGALLHESISDKKGCIGVNSIVQTEIGLFFAGNDGFYYTDGFQTIKISIDINDTYAKRTRSENQRRRIYGTYDGENRRIWWTMQSEPTASECDSAFIFYLDYGVKPSGVFTTASNENNWQPSALAFYNRELIRGDGRGYIFRHNAIYRSDPKVPTDYTLPLADWGFVHIPYDYKSCALDFGTIYVGQWVTKIHMLGDNQGNAAMQFWSIADNVNDDRGRKPLAPIFYQDNLMWGDPSIVWGDNSVIWRYDGKLDYWRRFTAKTLRSQVKQVQIKPARVGLYRSEDYANTQVRISSASKSVLLFQNPGFTQVKFPTDVVGLTISFGQDDYVHEFPILSMNVSRTVLFLDDPDGLLTPWNVQLASWVIRGYQKEAGLGVMSYVLHYANVGNRGRAYRGGVSRGENSGN